MKYSLYFLAIVLMANLAAALIDHVTVKCLVCREMMTDLNKQIQKIEKWRKVDVGKFRISKDGDSTHDSRPAHRSTTYIQEKIEQICNRMDDYVRVTFKATGKLTIMPLMIKDETGQEKMNPNTSLVKFITDDDLNKSLKVYCEDMFSDHEDDIMDLYVNRPDDDIMPDGHSKICFELTDYCKEHMLPNEADYNWTREMQEKYDKIHGPDLYSNLAMPGAPGFSSPVLPPEVQDIPDEDDLEDEEEPLQDIETEKDEL